MHSFYKPADLALLNTQAQEVGSMCSGVARFAEWSQGDWSSEKIHEFLEMFQTEGANIKNKVMFNFIYALTCDFFANIIQDDSLIEKAKAACTNALALYQTDRQSFHSFQSHFKQMMEKAANETNKKIWGLLNKITHHSISNWPEFITQCKELSEILQENLHLYTEEKRKFASKLIGYAKQYQNDEINAQEAYYPFTYTASLLLRVIHVEEDYWAAAELEKQMSGLSLNNNSRSNDNAKPNAKFWLVQELLADNKIEKFIFALIETLPKPQEPQKRRERRKLDDSVDIGNAPHDPMEFFERRIVRAKRRLQEIELKSDTDMNVEHTKPLDKKDESQNQKRHKPGA
jgi:hypothetical protein